MSTRLQTYFELLTPLTLTAQQKKRLNATLSSGSVEWGSSKLSWFYEFICDSLLTLQKYACCYCRRPLTEDRGKVEVEHILHKGEKTGHPHFAFHLSNLALSCKDCNNVKSVKSVLKDKSRKYKRYPSKNSFLWVHPYFYQYSEHLEIHQGWVYHPVIKKGVPSQHGVAVITNCQLYNMPMHEAANRKVIYSRSRDVHELVTRALAISNEVEINQVRAEITPFLKTMLNAKYKDGLDILDGLIAKLSSSP